MEYVYIDGMRVPIEGEKNLLTIIRKAGIDIPTFCYHSGLSTYGACRMCVVENEKGSVFASCSEVPWDGMKVFTNTPKLQKHRKMILELLLSTHCRDCTICDKSGKCTLQNLALRFGIKNIRFENYREQKPIDDSSLAITHDSSKCILCGDCVRMCEEVQGVGVLSFVHRGSGLEVAPAFNKKISETDCVGCGQCTAVCPTGALTVKNDTAIVWAALADKKKRVIAQIAPAVRVALGEEFGMEKGLNVKGKIVSSLRRLGFDEVYDTNFGADLTIMEESRELFNKLKDGKNLPLFTSCCPSWVRFCETKYPELLNNLSSAKSPMQMLAAVVKEQYRKMKDIDDRETFMVGVMPCTAKKEEAMRPEFSHKGTPDIDAIITTQELALMIKEAGIKFEDIESDSPDMPFGLSSGAGALFGVTGGVMEAALRLVVNERGNTSLKNIEFSGIRGLDGIKEASIDLGDNKFINVAVVSGLKNAEILVEKIKNKEVSYDFIEIMACRGGCLGGAGQPYTTDDKIAISRAKGIYEVDKTSQIKRSEENPVIVSLYSGILKGKVHELLHCPERVVPLSKNEVINK